MNPEELVNELTHLRLKDGDIVVWRTNDSDDASASLSSMWRDMVLPEGVVVLLIRPDESFDVLTDEALARAGLRRVKPRLPAPLSRSQARRFSAQSSQKVEYPEVGE